MATRILSSLNCLFIFCLSFGAIRHGLFVVRKLVVLLPTEKSPHCLNRKSFLPQHVIKFMQLYLNGVNAILHYESWHQPFNIFIFQRDKYLFKISSHFNSLFMPFRKFTGYIKKPPNFLTLATNCCCCFALHELFRMYNLNDL